MDRFISGLVSPQIKEKLQIPPQPANFSDAVNSAMAYTAAIFPEHQTLRQRSLAWKMAASNSHPLLTKSIHGTQRGPIQMLNASEEDNNGSPFTNRTNIPTLIVTLSRKPRHQAPRNGRPTQRKEVSLARYTSKQPMTGRNSFVL